MFCYEFSEMKTPRSIPEWNADGFTTIVRNRDIERAITVWEMWFVVGICPIQSSKRYSLLYWCKATISQDVLCVCWKGWIGSHGIFRLFCSQFSSVNPFPLRKPSLSSLRATLSLSHWIQWKAFRWKMKNWQWSIKRNIKFRRRD